MTWLEKYSIWRKIVARNPGNWLDAHLCRESTSTLVHGTNNADDFDDGNEDVNGEKNKRTWI